MANQWNQQGQFYGNNNTNFNGGGGPSYGNQQNNYFGSYATFDPYGMMGGSMLNMNMNMMGGPPPNPMQQNPNNNPQNNNQNNNNQNNNQNNNNNPMEYAFAPPPNDNNNNMNPPSNPMAALQNMAQQGSFYGPPPVNNNINNMNNMNNMNNNFAMNVPIPPMNAMQQMAQAGSFYGAPPMNNMNMNIPINNMNMNPNNINPNNINPTMPPPPPPKKNVSINLNGAPNNNNNGNNYYEQKLQGKKQKKKRKKDKKERREKRKKEKQKMLAAAGVQNNGAHLLGGNNDMGGYGGLSAPKPRRNQKKVSGRIRNSFLMTSSSGAGGNQMFTNPLMNSISEEKTNKNKQIGFRDNNNKKSKNSKGSRDPHAAYTEKRKKKVSYSKKETDKMASKLLTSDKNMKKLSQVKDIKQQNKLIMKKIHLCKYVCDFRSAGSGIIILDKSEKIRIENKYNLLTELLKHLKDSNWHETMGSDLFKFLESLFKMMSHNLFRVLPDGYIVEVVKTDTNGKDAKVTVTKELPSWKHFNLIYDIFECVLHKLKKESNKKKLFIISNLENFNVISNMVYLLNSEEVREEEMVANILIILYKHYSECRMFILGQLSNVCYSYLYMNYKSSISTSGRDLREKNQILISYSKQLASGVKTVLLIFKECLSNAAIEQIDGWVELLCSVIIPLHKACIEEFIIFDDALGKISMVFCEKYFLSFIYIFQGMLRYWPLTSSKKEQLFLHRIGPLLDLADEDVWEFKDKMKCEFRDVFTGISNKIVDSIQYYKHTHYATVEKITEMLEDDTLQRFLDIYGGKNCWIKLYKSLFDISTKFFWKETIDKTLEFMENCKEEDDIPMQYLNEFESIDKNIYSRYIEKENKENNSDGDNNEYIIEKNRLKNKKIQRKKYYIFLNKKYEKKTIAKYQKHVYKNNQPMLALQNENHIKTAPSINWNGNAMQELTHSMESLLNKKNNKNNNKKQKKYKTGKSLNIKPKPKPPPPPSDAVNNGLPPPQIWDDDDF